VSDKQNGDWDFVIHSYSVDQALADGVLQEPFDNRCYNSHPPKRLVMTAAIAESLTHADLQKVWDGWLEWILTAEELPEEERMYTFDFHGRQVWVLEDGVAITILFAEDY